MIIERWKKWILDHKIECLTGSVIVTLLLAFMLFSNRPVKNNESVFKTDKIVKNKKKTEKNFVKIIYVDIQGEVNRPGFYHLKRNARVFDLLQLAGGLKDSADRKNVNQAKKLADQEQVYVPKIGEVTDQVIKSTSVASDDTNEKQINLNTATVDELQNLSGVGPKKAEKIVQYREENGDFEKVEDLTKVSGFGDKSLESLKEQITV